MRPTRVGNGDETEGLVPTHLIVFPGATSTPPRKVDARRSKLRDPFVKVRPSKSKEDSFYPDRHDPSVSTAQPTLSPTPQYLVPRGITHGTSV